MQSFQFQLAEFDKLIKQGKTEVCKTQFNQIKIGEIPREFVADFAKVALRLNLPLKAYSLLKEAIQLDNQAVKNATDFEKLQFGMALKQMGASSYAVKVFDRIDPKKSPEVLLYKAICNFNSWEYQAAEKELADYLKFTNLTEMQRLVGNLNYAAALAHNEKLDIAEKTIMEVQRLATSLNHSLILANSLELLTQVYISNGDLKRAKECIQKAEKLIEDPTSTYSLFIAKWKAITEVIESKASQDSLQSLNKVRDEAIHIKHWESVRDCDFYFATQKNDEYLFQRLFFGSPYKEYRKRLRSKIKHFDIPESFNWSGNQRLINSKITEKLTIDLTEMEVKIGQFVDDQFHLNVLILKALCYDFYVPVKPVALYLRAFPNENLVPEEAVQRVFNGVSKLNALLRKEKIPIEVVSNEDGYRLNFKDVFFIKLPKEIEFTTRPEYFGRRLISEFSTKEFSSGEISTCLKLSKRTTTRYLKEAVDAGIISSSGSGSKTRYRVKS